jgi:plastocyanin
MKRIVQMALILLAMVVTGCSRVKVVPQDEAHMGSANFIQTAVTVKVGQPVRFIVNGDGAAHILVVGSNGIWIANLQAPDKLNNPSGISIAPGQEVDVPFSTPGSYQITCTIHQSMLLTVTVTPWWF